MNIRVVRTLALICVALLVPAAQAAASPVSEFRHGSSDIKQVAFVPGKDYFIVSSGYAGSWGTKIWAFGGIETGQISGMGNDLIFAISPGGMRRFVTTYREDPLGSSRGFMIMWDMGRGAHKLWTVSPGNRIIFENVVFTPDGKRVIATMNNLVSETIAITIRDTETGRELRNIPADRYYRLAVSPNGRYVAGGKTRTSPVKMWDMETGRELRTFSKGQCRFSSANIAFSPDGKHILATGATDEKKEELDYVIWDVETGREVAAVGSLRDDTGKIRPANVAVYSPDGRFIATGAFGNGGSGGFIALRNAETGAPVWSKTVDIIQDSGYNYVAFSSDGRFLVSGHPDGFIRVWDVSEIYTQP
jgi:WD40 repeat protein